MKKTVTPLRSLCAALAALVLLLALAAPAFAADGFADLYYRMNDSAEVLTEDEDGELEASLEELSVRQSFDVIIATIDSLESEGCTSMKEYADDLYDYCQFGYGENRDGVLLLFLAVFLFCLAVVPGQSLWGRNSRLSAGRIRLVCVSVDRPFGLFCGAFIFASACRSRRWCAVCSLPFSSCC